MPLTQATAFGADGVNSRWSPDGSEIVFESSRNVDGADAPNAAVNIWKMTADGTGIEPLTRSTATDANSSNPLWSPDGTEIVFDSFKNVDGTDTTNPNLMSNVWRVKAGGSGLLPLGTASALKAGSSNAIWSPGSTRVIFLSTRNIDGSNSVNPNGTVNIWRVNADGSGLSPVTRVSARSADCSSFQLRP
jgi:Tol biopolymer transport system component